MTSKGPRYDFVKKKLAPQMKKCRTPDVRQRAEFILYALKIKNVTLAAKRLGFSRALYYKWFNRLRKANFKLSSLKEKSRRPCHSPQKITFSVEHFIRKLRRKGYGAPMICELLKREMKVEHSISTIQHVINERKKIFIKKRKPKLKKHRKRYELYIPGERLQMDVKFVPCLVEGKKAYTFVAIDECTRWRYAKTYLGLNPNWTIDFLDHLVANCPFPIHAIQTDNGIEFTFRLLPHVDPEKHPMHAWCKNHKIIHQCIPPGLKELNGKVERSHRVDADYFYGRAPTTSIETFNRSLRQWINHYNHARPHGGIGYMTPMEKLAERCQSLRKQILQGEAETKRQKFLANEPRRTQKHLNLDGQQESLELLLWQYNNFIASGQ